MHPLKRARVLRGMKQIELAKAAGVTQQAISKIERGLQTGSAITLKKLAAALGVTVDEIIEDGADTPLVPAPVRSLSVDQRRVLLSAIAGKRLPPMPGKLKQLAEIRRDAIRGGMSVEEFNAWFRRATVEDVREELLPEEHVSLEEQLIG